MLIYFLLCALSFFACNAKTISTESAMFLGKYYFFAKFNNDVIFCAVDLEDPVSHHTRNLYAISATHIPTPYKDNVTVLVDNKVQLKGIEYTAQLSFINSNQDSVDDFHIVITDSDEPIVGSTSVYSFAHKIKHKEYSIVDLLYTQHKIESKKFTLEMTNNPKGHIFFGDIPTDVLSNYTHMMKVPLSDKSSPYWQIDIEYIFIDAISYVYTNVYMKTQYKAKLSAKEYTTYVPVSVMDFIKEEIFSDYFSNKSCTEGYDGVKCKCEVISSLRNFSLIINERIVNITTNRLFVDIDKICYFELAENKENPLEWVLNSKLLDKFMLTFDYESESVTFYSRYENFISIDLDTLFPTKRIVKMSLIIIVVILTLIFGRMFYVICKKRRKNHINQFIEEFYIKL